MIIAFIVNSRLRSFSKWEKQIEELKNSSDLRFMFKSTNSPGEAILLTDRAIKDGARIIVAVGGDGTFNEAANAILNSHYLKDIIFTGIAAGTANDFCKTLSTPKTLSQLIKAIHKNKVIHIDVGKATFFDISGKPCQRYFINAANVGAAAEIIEEINNSSKLLGNTWRYLKSISKSVLIRNTEDCIVKTSDTLYKDSFFNITISNGKYIGNGLNLSPDASLTDGKFNIILLTKFNFKDYIINLPKAYKGIPIKHPSFKTFVSDKIIVENLVSPLCVELDGEFVGYTQAEFTLEPQKLKVLDL
jgi:YegS/Rv2252/BmrU family lipid kinase